MSTLFGVTIVPTFPSQTCSGQIVHHLSVPNTSSHQNKRAKKKEQICFVGPVTPEQWQKPWVDNNYS